MSDIKGQLDVNASYNYKTGTNQLSKIEKNDQNSTKTTTNFLYDENGNLLKDASHEYIYDKKARLVGVDNNVLYAYNHENTRVSKTINAEMTHFIYDGSKLIGEYNGDGSVKNEYLYLDGTPLAVTNATQTLYIHTDHLGTPRRLADENANIVWSWESEPFGESKAVGSVEFNLRFAGQYFDNETSIHYNINRDYDPKTGRYVQSDPIGFDGGVNSYGYVAGNPLGAVDEMGLIIKYNGTASQKLLLKTIVDNLKRKSKKGKEIIDVLESRYIDYPINYIKKNAYFIEQSSDKRIENNAYIDPYYNIKLVTTGNILTETPPEIVLAHELGHALGYHDDGKGQMSNVNKN